MIYWQLTPYMQTDLTAELFRINSLPIEQKGLEEYRLRCIYKELYYSHRDKSLVNNLRDHDVRLLVDICIDVINNRNAIQASDILRKCKSIAARILVIILFTYQIGCDQEDSLHECLISILRVEPATEQEEELRALSAKSLSFTHLNHLLAPEKTFKLIMDMLPLASVAFIDEFRNSSLQFDDLNREDFHCFSTTTCIGFNLAGPFSRYRMYMHLLVRLLASDSGQHCKRLHQLLEQATLGQVIESRVFIVINALLSCYTESSRLGSQQNSERNNARVRPLCDIMVNLLGKVDDCIGSHMVYLLFKCYKSGYVIPRDLSCEIDFLGFILDHVIRCGNGLSAELLVEFMNHFETNCQRSQDRNAIETDIYLELFAGKELSLIKRLTSLDIRLEVIHHLIKHIDRCTIGADKCEVDKLVLIPLKTTIHRLVDLLKHEESDDQDVADLIRILYTFAVDRSHRPPIELELQIIEIATELIKDERRDHIIGVDVLYQVNRYQVHSKIWDLFQEMLVRYQTLTNDLKIKSYKKYFKYLLKGLIIRDSDYFYLRVASVNIIQSILDYCKKEVHQGHRQTTFLRDMLVTWPQVNTMTLLDLETYNQLLEEFIALIHCDGRSPASQNGFQNQIEGIRDSGAFVLAFSRHPQALVEVWQSCAPDLSVLEIKSSLFQSMSKWFKLVRMDYVQRSEDYIQRAKSGLHDHFIYLSLMIEVHGLRSIRKVSLALRTLGNHPETAEEMESASQSLVRLLRNKLNIVSDPFVKKLIDREINIL